MILRAILSQKNELTLNKSTKFYQEVTQVNHKIKTSINLLNSYINTKNNVYLLFTPDQGSLLCTYLVYKHTSKRVSVLFVDTKQHFEEVYLFLNKLRKLWSLNIIQRTTISLVDPKKLSRNDCCHLLKAQVLRRAEDDLCIDLLITGIKASELKSQWNIESASNSKKYTIINPIENLSEDEVVATVNELNLPRCSLWASGLYSIDCKPCTKLPQSFCHLNHSKEDEEVKQRLKCLGYC